MPEKTERNLSYTVCVFFLQIIVFLMPINQSYLSPIIGLWILSVIWVMIVSKFKVYFSLPSILLIAFYLLLMCGISWSDNKDIGWFDMEVKMSLTIFPILFFFLRFSHAELKRIIKSFLFGLLISSVFLGAFAIKNFYDSHLVDDLFYTNLSYIIHPSYLSSYFVIAIFIILYDLYSKRLKLFKNQLSYLFLAGWLFVFNILILSKIGIITSVLIIIIFLLFRIINYKKYIEGLIIFLGISGVLIFSYQNSPYVKQRMYEMFVGVNSTNADYENSSSSIRIKIWNESMELVKEKPLIGYGTGDVREVLMQRYFENNISLAYEKQLNAHNQFIQIALAVGLVGLFLFLMVLAVPLIIGLKTHNYLIVGFILISVSFFLPESVLENKAGTIFFGLFYCLFNQFEVKSNQ